VDLEYDPVDNTAPFDDKKLQLPRTILWKSNREKWIQLVQRANEKDKNIQQWGFAQ
jgi:hypothetical protein